MAVQRSYTQKMHVRYECPGAVPVKAGNPLPPPEGHAHLMAIAISKKQNAQARRFALLMPEDDNGPMFFVSLDGGLSHRAGTCTNSHP